MFATAYYLRQLNGQIIRNTTKSLGKPFHMYNKKVLLAPLNNELKLHKNHHPTSLTTLTTNLDPNYFTLYFWQRLQYSIKFIYYHITAINTSAQIFHMFLEKVVQYCAKHTTLTNNIERHYFT